MEIFKPISYFCDRTSRKKCWIKGWLFSLSAGLAFSIIRTSCSQKNGLKACLAALQSMDLQKVCRKPGPNPSDQWDLRPCSYFGVQKWLKFESQKNNNGFHTESVPFKPFKIQIRERPHSCLSPFQSFLEMDRQYFDLNDSNLSCFWTQKFVQSMRSVNPDGFGPGFLHTFCGSILWRAA